jgi:Tfp pilus assembly protein PilN
MEIKLNLMPPTRKNEIAKSENLKFVIGVQIMVAIILLILLSVLGSFKYVLGFEFEAVMSSFEKNSKEIQYEKIKKYEEDFNSVNSQITEIIGIRRDQIYWSKLFSKLNEIAFLGIEIDSISTDNYTITISGMANNRDDLILFKEKLESEDCFLGVDLPLSNLVNKDNVEFKIDFFIKEECLKK